MNKVSAFLVPFRLFSLFLENPLVNPSIPKTLFEKERIEPEAHSDRLMKLQFARQPFVQAFLTLLVVCVIALWGVAPAEPVAAGAAAYVSERIGAGMAFALPREMLLRFQENWPVLARLSALFTALLSGIAVGRVSVRPNLYGVNTCLAIPLFGMLVCCLAGRGISLTVFCATLLLAFAVKHFCAAFRNGYSFDRLFRASSCLGLLVLIRPAALPLLLLLPFGVLLFQRTQRETVVALAGLSLAPLLLCYVNWLCGGTFVAPLIAVWNDFFGGEFCALFRSGMTSWFGVAGGFLWLNICGIGSIWANFYSVGARARYRLVYNIGVLVLCIASLCGPAVSTADAAWMAVPSAVLLPFFFVRIHATFSTLLYLSILAVAMAVLLFLPLA